MRWQRRSVRAERGAAIAALLVTLACSASSRAQSLVEPRARQGYYLAVGDELYGSGEWGPHVAHNVTPGQLLIVRAGEMMTPRWGVGFHFDYAVGIGNAKTHDSSGSLLEFQFNPVRNLALHSGVGLGTVTINFPNDLAHPSRSGYGSLYEVGVSWALFFTNRLTGGWAITPTATARYLPGGEVSGLWFGLGLQFEAWTGLPRNRLILPDTEAYKKDLAQ
ncbi:MAG TPA: hypothetical protein VHM31_21860 [Polyangia bacterium]|nr:hypothetical protein [Polyangia bacterium]